MIKEGFPRELRYAFVLGTVALLAFGVLACVNTPQTQLTPEATRAPISAAIVTATPAEHAPGTFCYFPQTKERKPPTNMRNIIGQYTNVNALLDGLHPKISLPVVFDQLIDTEVVTDQNKPCQTVARNQKALILSAMLSYDSSIFAWTRLTCGPGGWSNEERNMIFSTPGEATEYVEKRAKGFVRPGEPYTARIVPETNGYIARLNYTVNPLGDYNICHTFVDGKPSYDGTTFETNQYLHLIP